jgi:hypothetical protein
LTFLLLAGLALACGEKLPTEKEKVIPPAPDTAVYRDLSSTHLPEVAKAAGQRSMEARAVDVDADGDLDLIVAREARPNVLLLNDGQGRFSDASGRIPQVALDSEDIAVGDFDRDGDPDVVIVTEDPVGGVRYNEYYLNDGQGNFSDVHTRLPPTIESNAVAAADIDKDGDLDLVVGDRGRERALMNDGRGFFSDESATRLPAVPLDATQDVTLGDVDRDGDLDLVVANEQGTNQLLLNDGRGFFTPAPAGSLPLRQTREATRNADLGDVDGDGDLDLVVANEQGTNQLLLNDGRGFFTPAPEGSLPLRQTREATRNADLGDVDGDGDLDLLFANVSFGGGDPQGRLLLNDGRGVFSDVTSARLAGMVVGAIDADLVDLDGDGDIDIVTAHFPAGPFRVYLNGGGGSFGDATARFFPPGLIGQGLEIEAADFDRDQRLDLYLANFVESPDMLLLTKR